MTGMASSFFILSKRGAGDAKEAPLASIFGFLPCQILAMPGIQDLQHVALPTVAPGIYLLVGLNYPTPVTIVQEGSRVLFEVEKFFSQFRG